MQLGVFNGYAGLRGDTCQNLEIGCFESSARVKCIHLNRAERLTGTIQKRRDNHRTNTKVGNTIGHLKAFVA